MSQKGYQVHEDGDRRAGDLADAALRIMLARGDDVASESQRKRALEDAEQFLAHAARLRLDRKDED